MQPTDVNGVVPSDRPKQPMTFGQIQSADFVAGGNLLLLYKHLKDMYEPPVKSESGPIKQLTAEEIERDKNKLQEDFVNSLTPTIPVSPTGK
jgi:hypothetical protein